MIGGSIASVLEDHILFIVPGATRADDLTLLKVLVQLSAADGPAQVKLDLLLDHFGFTLPAERAGRALNQIIAWRGALRTIRVGNGPEYISGTLMEWAENKGIALVHIQPENHSRMLLSNATTGRSGMNGWIFESIDEVQQIATAWLWPYNNERPNMGNGGMTPAQILKMPA